MENEWITVSELSNKIGVPIPSIRRYIQIHHTFLHSKKIGKKIFLHKDSIKMLEVIRKMYVESNLSGEEIEEQLINQGMKQTFTVHEESPVTAINQSEINESLKLLVASQQETNERLKQQDQELQIIKDHLQKQEEFNKLLVDKLDKRFMENVRAIQEMKQAQLETAPTEEIKKKWWQLFQFWK